MKFGKLIMVMLVVCLMINSTAATIEMQSPETSSFQNAGEGGEPGADGNVGFSLPIGAVSGKSQLSLPLTLSYSSGVRLDQEASWVGLGFNLGVGQISRNVVNNPDDSSSGFLNSDNDFGDQDTYSIIFPGGSGKIVFDENKVPHLTNWQNLRIEMFDDGDKYGEHSGNFEIDKWIVTTMDGTRYVFGGTIAGTEATAQTSRTIDSVTLSWDDSAAQTGCNAYADDNSDTVNEFTQSWYLVAILSADYKGTGAIESNNWQGPSESDRGDWIKIEYDAYRDYDYIYPNPRVRHVCENPNTCDQNMCMDFPSDTPACDDDTGCFFTWQHCSESAQLIWPLSNYAYSGAGSTNNNNDFEWQRFSYNFFKRETTVDMLYVSKISSPVMNAEFDYDTTSRKDGMDHSDISEGSTEEINLCESQNEKPVVVSSYNGISSYSGKKLARLNNVNFYKNDASDVLSRVHFEYVSDPLELAQEAEGLNNDGRLTLDYVQVFGLNGEALPKTSFEYYGQSTPYHKYAWDWWGYHNGETDQGYFGLRLLAPYCALADCDESGFSWELIDDYFFGTSTDQVPDRPDIPMPNHETTDAVSTWSIKKVNYPTGGSVEYEYEAGKYKYEMDQCLKGQVYNSNTKDYNRDCSIEKAGGIRLKSKTLNDGLENTPSYKVAYDYGDGVVTQQLGWQSRFKNDWVSMGAHSQNGIIYRWVEKTQLNEADEAIVGKTRTVYSTVYDNPIDLYECSDSVCLDDACERTAGYKRDVVNDNIPFIAYPISSVMYAGNGDLVMESSSDYVSPIVKAEYRDTVRDSDPKKFDCNLDYDLNSEWMPVDSSETTQDGITVNQIFFYDTETGMLREQVTENSDGSKRHERSTRLATANINEIGNPTDYAAQQAAIEKHMYTLPYEQKIKYSAPGSLNSVEESVSKAHYAFFDGSGYVLNKVSSCDDCALLPYYNEVWMEDSNDDGMAGVRDVWQESGRMLKYDKYGRVLEAQDAKEETTYAFYGSEGECSHPSNGEDADTMSCVIDANGNEVKAYYDELDRIVAIQDANGLFSNYYYDDLNRLYAVSAPSGGNNLLKNPGFERGTAEHGVNFNGGFGTGLGEVEGWYNGWNAPNPSRHNSIEAGENSNVHSGLWSLKLEGGNIEASYHSDVEVPEGTYYLSGWSKSVNGCQIEFNMAPWHIDGETGDSGASGTVGSTSGEWNFIQVSVDLNDNTGDGLWSGAFKIEIDGDNACQGYAFVDDVSLTATETIESAPFFLATVTGYNYGMLGTLPDSDDLCPSLNYVIDGHVVEDCSNYVQTTSIVDDDDQSIGRSYVDGLGRHKQTSVVESLDPITAIYVTTEYNERGLVDSVSAPVRDEPGYFKMLENKHNDISDIQWALAPVVEKLGDESFEKAGEGGGEGEDNVKYLYYNDPRGRVYKVFPWSSFQDYMLDLDLNPDEPDDVALAEEILADKNRKCGHPASYGGEQFAEKLDCTMTEFEADANGDYLISTITDAEGKFVTSKTDKLGNALEVENAEAEMTEFQYNIKGQVEKVWDAERPAGEGKSGQAAKENVYNKAGQLVETEDINTEGSTVYEYDENGNILRVLEADGLRETEFEYDALNRVRKVFINGRMTKENLYGDGGDDYPDYNCVLDCPDCSSVGLLCEVRDGLYNTKIKYWYDEASRLVKVDEFIGRDEYNTLYEYNVGGGVSRIEMENTEWISYDYNMMNQLQYADIKNVPQIHDGHSFKFTYDDIGAIDTISYPNEAVQNFEYTDKKFVNQIDVSLDDVTLFGEAYGYDNVGNLVSITNMITSDRAEFDYDNAYRLEYIRQDLDDAYYTNDGDLSFTEIEYVYDGVGNRQERNMNAGSDGDGIVWTESYVYDPGTDKLVATNEEGCNYDYDDFGNMYRKTCGSDVTNYVYDENDMISRITMPTGKVFTFVYDPVGRRVIKKESAAGKTLTTTYSYGSGSNPLIVDEERDSVPEDLPDIMEQPSGGLRK